MNENYKSNTNIAKQLNYLPKRLKIMVELDKENLKITVTLSGDSSSLLNMQLSIVRLVQCYNFNDYPPQNGEIFWAMNLLEEMLLNDDQTERAFSVEERHVKLPKNLTDKQKTGIREALSLIETEPATNSTNLVFQALKKVG